MKRLLFVLLACGAGLARADEPLKLVDVRKIWDQAPHNAFTDLIFSHDRWFCVFREGKSHVSPDGAMRVITSTDGQKWESAALLTSPDSDLRDAKITALPDGELMLSGAEALHDKSQHTHQSLAWFSVDGRKWSEKVKIGDPDFWLWRVTWHKGNAYGIGYGCGKDQSIRLYSSSDGVKFDTLVKNLFDVGYPTETSLTFDGDTCYCLLRRDGKPNTGMIGTSQPPYTKWEWKDLGLYAGGPQMIRLPDGRLIAAVRLLNPTRTSLVWIDPKAGKLTECLKLPSGGDTSYAGLVWHDGLLWVSYYSSHEGKTSIYLAKVQVPPAVADIGSRRELFVDDFLIDTVKNAKLTMHRPEPGDVVLACDSPWEGNISAYFTVFADGDRFRMLYRGAHIDEKTQKETHPQFTCYAESKDGIHWEKPKLGLFEFNGSKDNNIVAGEGDGAHNFVSFKDTNPACSADARYKAVATGKGGLHAYKSADCIHWSPLRDAPVITNGDFDSQNLAFWYPQQKRYLDFHRKVRNGKRDIMTCSSADFINWTEPVFLEYGDAPREDLYTNAIQPYFRAPHLLLGFPTRFQPKTEQVEPILMTSRDGLTFKRWPEPLIPMTAPKDRDGNRSNYMAWGLLQLPGQDRELSVYGTEAYYKGPAGRLRRFTFRTDGFVSLRAGADAGEMITHPLRFSGKELALNYATGPGGSVRVEIQDADGKPLPGFALADCKNLAGDAIDQKVAWGKATDVSSLASRPVRLRFALQNADVYALQFEPAPALTEQERTTIRSEANQLQKRLAVLRANPTIKPEHVADAGIFVKGVVWALDFEPTLDGDKRTMVERGLRRAGERIDALAAGRQPWTERRGKSIRGFVSAVDGSTQPYGLVVPAGYDPAKPIRLDVVLHGSRGATGIGDLAFIGGFDGGGDAGAQPAPDVPYIEVHPMGRLGENAYRFEGETDVDEAIAAVERDFRIDRSRIVLRGSSLGGVSAWQLGLKRPDRYVAIGPAAGPVDTIEFAASKWPHFVPLDPITPWQKTMLHLVDAIDYTANAGMVPVVAAMGDQDHYFPSHLLIEKEFAKEHVPFVGLVDRGAGHGLTQKVMDEQLRLIGEHAAKGTDPARKHVRFVTWTLKFSRCNWLEILGLEQHYQRAEIDAQMADDGSITLAEPKNITRFALRPPALRTKSATLTIGAAKIDLPPMSSDEPRTLVIERRAGAWQCQGNLSEFTLNGKRPGMQGPIDDAFATPFLCVRGTGRPWNPAVGAWADASLKRVAYEWRRHYRGELPVKNDSDVTPDDLREKNLILFGDPGSNRLIGQIVPKLPLRWTREEIQLGKDRYPAGEHGLQMIYPNPLPGAHDHYVVFNSGHTYHDAALRFSYMVYPRLGDWAVLKVGKDPATSSEPIVAETVLQSGFFDEAWGLR